MYCQALLVGQLSVLVVENLCEFQLVSVSYQRGFQSKMFTLTCLYSYKQQLANGLKREQTLEQKLVQLELDWKRCYEDVRAEDYIRDKELLESLAFSRDKVGHKKL